MVKIIPIKLQPIDKPNNTPLLKSSKELDSLPAKYIYNKYNKLPSVINDIPDFNVLINISPY